MIVTYGITLTANRLFITSFLSLFLIDLSIDFCKFIDVMLFVLISI